MILSNQNHNLGLPITDIINLVIVKASSFALIGLIFVIVNRNVDSSVFVDFGYYWGIALMFGGILVGGLSSTMIRLVAVPGAWRHLVQKQRLSLVVVGLVLFSAINALFQNLFGQSTISLYLTLLSFGLIFQCQIAVMTIVRAMQKQRVLLLCSVSNLVVVSFCIFYSINERETLQNVFSHILLSYSIGFMLIFTLSLKTFRDFGKSSSAPSLKFKDFWHSYLSFTSINIFSYLFVVMDFYLLKEFLSEDEFVSAGYTKIYFDRFVVPVLTVLAGAASINLLRSLGGSLVGNRDMTVALVTNKKRILLFLSILAMVAGGYYIFVIFMRGSVLTQNIFVVLCILLAYTIYAFNAVLLDILALKHGSKVVFQWVLVFLLIAILIYSFLINLFQFDGWIVGCLVLNTAFCYGLFNKCLAGNTKTMEHS